MNGLHLQQRIAATHAPIVFVVGGPADVASSVRALKAGAVDFLTSPVCSRDLFCAVEWAIELDRRTAPERIRLAQLHARYQRLTPREREVLGLIVSGRLNKQAAVDLGISENTLQIHRRRVMRKMEARTLPDLVRMADALNAPCSRRVTDGSRRKSAATVPSRYNIRYSRAALMVMADLRAVEAVGRGPDARSDKSRVNRHRDQAGRAPSYPERRWSPRQCCRFPDEPR